MTTTKETTRTLLANRHDYDEQVFRTVASFAPDSGRVLNDPLVSDIFSTAYRLTEPEFVKEPGSSEDENILEALRRLQDRGVFNNIRRHTKLNPLYSYVVGRDMAQAVREAARQIEEAKENDADLGGIPGGVLKMVTAVEEQVEQLEEAEDDLMPGGQYPSGSDKDAPSAARMQEAFQFLRVVQTPRMQRFALAIGRFRRLFSTEMSTRVTNQPVEITGVSRGNDIANMTPYQRMMFGHPVLKLAACKDFTERQLQQYKKQARVKEDRGGVIIAKDCSGSMASGGGQRDIEATALTMAVREQCEKERRDFWTFNFTQYAYGKSLATGREKQLVPNDPDWSAYYCPKGKPDPREFLQAFGRGPNGDNEGMIATLGIWHVVDHSAKALKEADALMICDGQTGARQYADQIRAGNTQRGIRLFVLLVEGGDMREALAITDADRIMTIKDVTNPGERQEVVHSIANGMLKS